MTRGVPGSGPRGYRGNGTRPPPDEAAVPPAEPYEVPKLRVPASVMKLLDDHIKDLEATVAAKQAELDELRATQAKMEAL